MSFFKDRRDGHVYRKRNQPSRYYHDEEKKSSRVYQIRESHDNSPMTRAIEQKAESRMSDAYGKLGIENPYKRGIFAVMMNGAPPQYPYAGERAQRIRGEPEKGYVGIIEVNPWMTKFDEETQDKLLNRAITGLIRETLPENDNTGWHISQESKFGSIKDIQGHVTPEEKAEFDEFATKLFGDQVWKGEALPGEEEVFKEWDALADDETAGISE